MTTATNALHNPISPVNVEERKELGIQAGDTVRVHLRIQEGEKTRMQIFEGMVLATKHGSEAGATFTVRRVVDGVGVERIFPLYSPVIDKIEIVKRSKVRRSKLYYIRDKAVRQIKRQMRRMVQVDRATEGEMARAERESKEAKEAAAQAEEKATDAEASAESSGAEDTQEKGNKESAGKDITPDEPIELEEKVEEQTVAENKEGINQADPEKNEVQQAEEKIEEESEKREG